MKLFKEQNFEEKGWQVTYRSIARSSDQANILKTDGDLTEFLGIEWKPSEDIICRVLKLNFSKKRQEEKLKLKSSMKISRIVCLKGSPDEIH